MTGKGYTTPGCGTETWTQQMVTDKKKGGEIRLYLVLVIFFFFVLNLVLER